MAFLSQEHPFSEPGMSFPETETSFPKTGMSVFTATVALSPEAHISLVCTLFHSALQQW